MPVAPPGHQPYASVVIDIDGEALENVVIGTCTAIVQRVTGDMMVRAKHHAPVRAIFKRTRRGSAKRGDFFPRGERYAIDTAEQYAQWKRSRAVRRRVLPREGGVISGHPNDWVSVFQATSNRTSKRPGHPVFRFAGQIRNVSSVSTSNTNEVSKLVSDVVHARQLTTSGGKKLAEGWTRETKAQKTTLSRHGIDPNDLLTSRGRYDLAHGRKPQRGQVKIGGKEIPFHYKPIYRGFENDSPLGHAKQWVMQGGKLVRVEASARRSLVETLGGRLRGEITLRPAMIEDDVIWGWVISPVAYSYYQEFGTRRSRAHPYMRPALYESRASLRTTADSLLRRQLKSSMGRLTLRVELAAWTT